MARIIALVICCGFALMFLSVGVTQWLQQRRNLGSAGRVDAVIVASSVRTSRTADTDGRVGFSNSTPSYAPDVRFRYTVAGQAYESDRLYPSIIERGYASSDAAARELAPFPLNATVRAYVDVAHPERAFLIAESSHGPIVFIVLGVLLPPLGWAIGKYVV